MAYKIMKITTNPVVGTWERAESDLPRVNTVDANHIPCQTGKILIVDDEEGIRRVFNMVLSTSIQGDRKSVV